MKKFLTFFALATTLFILTACGGGNGEEEAFALLTRSQEAMEEVDSMISETVSTVTTNFDGEEMEQVSTATASVIYEGETGLEMRVDTVMNMLGEEMSSTTYFRDGTMYMDMMGTQMQMPMPIEDAMAAINTSNVAFPEDAIVSQSVETVGENRKLIFEVDMEALLNAEDGAFSAITEMLGGGMAGVDTEEMAAMFADSVMSTAVVIDDNYNMVSQSTSFDITMEVEGIEMTMNMVMEMEVTQVGDVTIEFPADLDTFPEA